MPHQITIDDGPLDVKAGRDVRRVAEHDGSGFVELVEPAEGDADRLGMGDDDSENLSDCMLVLADEGAEEDEVEGEFLAADDEQATVADERRRSARQDHLEER